MSGLPRTKSQKALQLNIPVRQSYGLDSHRGTQTKYQHETQPRSLYHPETKRQHSSSHSDRRLPLGGDKNGYTPQKGTGQLHVKASVDQKEVTYRNQIQQLIKQNEELRLQQRQAQIRAADLESRISLGEEASQYKRKLLFSANGPDYENDYNRHNLLGRYQLTVRRTLQLYGCSRDQSSIEHCTSEKDIIDFVLKMLGERYEGVKAKEAEERAKLAQDQRQIAKVRESLKLLTETNELFKSRQQKYKEKAEEMRREWLAVTTKLSKSESIREQLQLEQAKLEQSLCEHQKDTIRVQETARAENEDKQRVVVSLQAQLAKSKSDAARSQARCVQLQMELEQANLESKQLQLRLKLKDEELERSNRETVRWKERFEWLEHEKAGQPAKEFKRSIVESRKRFSPEYAPEQQRSKKLENIQERSSDILDDKESSSVVPDSHPLLHSQNTLNEDASKPKFDLNRNESSAQPPKEVHFSTVSGVLQSESVVRPTPLLRRIQTRGQTIPESSSKPSATNLLANMLQQLEQYADHLEPR